MNKEYNEIKPLILSNDLIIKKIHRIRGIQVMIDNDLAELYCVPVKALNQAVKRNKERFPSDFMFQLSKLEKNELVTNCDYLKNLKFTLNNPYAFTEQGIATLSGVLKSEQAISMNIQIIRAFVSMRNFISKNAEIFYRINSLEKKQLEFEINSDKKFKKIFDALESEKPKQGIFFNGEVFDAHKFVSDLVRSAQYSISIIDNYVDDSVLTLLSKCQKNVNVIIYTNNISKQLILDVEKYNTQYTPIRLKEFNLSHDRFIIIDKKEVYHIGASLKDLGKKWFAFSKIEIDSLKFFEKLKKEDEK